MTRIEGQRINPEITNHLNLVGNATESISNAVFVLTVLESVREILSNKSPKNTLIKGALVAFGIKLISAASDVSVDQINRINELG